MSNSIATVDSGKTAKSKRSRKPPLRKRLLRLFDRSGHFLGQFGVSFSGVQIIHCNEPPNLAAHQTDPSLIFEELNPRDITQLKDYRDETLIRARLEKGYSCRVAKNQQGLIDNVRWYTNHPYYCWPVRMIIDPGPRGWYCFDGFTMPHARRRHRFSQHFAAWYNMQPSGTRPIVGVVSLWNDVALIADRKVGFVDICRVYCISVFGFKLVRVRWILPEPSVQWIVRSRGKAFTYDACKLRIY